MNLPINLVVDKNLLIDIYSKIANTIKIEDYVLNLINKDINSIILIKDNIYFNKENGKVYKGDMEVILTKTENTLFKLLFNNCNRLVTFEEIEAIIWKNKVASRFTLRNHIKHLRNKTNTDLIKNQSNRGYMMIVN